MYFDDDENLQFIIKQSDNQYPNSAFEIFENLVENEAFFMTK